jgi:predicted transport protein
MSDIKLFKLTAGQVTEISGKASHLEKPLQNLIEANLEQLLGIRFLSSEYSTGKTHAGRIDTLGIDENNCPVIIEYKRASSENIINQGLFYLDWLMDHQAELKLLVLEKYGKQASEDIDWSAPRLVCVASDFTRYDSHAVQQINRNIELIRYRKFGDDLLLFELVNAVSAPPQETATGKSTDKTVAEWLKDLPANIEPVFDSLDKFCASLGDDVQRKDLKLYIAYKRIRNFATIVFQKKNLRVFLHLDPDKVSHIDGLTRDVTGVGHWGTGNVELAISSSDDLEKVKHLIEQAYEGGA